MSNAVGRFLTISGCAGLPEVQPTYKSLRPKGKADVVLAAIAIREFGHFSQHHRRCLGPKGKVDVVLAAISQHADDLVAQPLCNSKHPTDKAVGNRAAIVICANDH